MREVLEHMTIENVLSRWNNEGNALISLNRNYFTMPLSFPHLIKILFPNGSFSQGGENGR